MALIIPMQTMLLSTVVWAVLSCLALAAPLTAASDRFTIDPRTHQIVDQYQRTRIFHGVNIVYKPAPFFPPITDHFDAQNSLCTQDYEQLQEWGVNIVRLYVAWEGVEPMNGVYNTTYLSAVRAMVDRFAQYGIYVLLDAHQDSLAREYCGEGVPSWAVNATLKGSTYANFPAPVPGLKIAINQSTHLPDITSCSKNNFALYYFSYGVSESFQNLYDNTNGMQDAFLGFWRQVARAFQDAPNVIGYDLINEPWMGDIYKNPGLFIPGNADKQNLSPMYDRIANVIREEDQGQKFLFFEPITWDFFPSGFQHVPGGAQFANQTILSFHVYCPTYSVGNPLNKYLCKLADDKFFTARMEDIARLGGGSFLTEFGALGDANSDVSELNRVLDLADKYKQGFMYWQYKSYGDYTTSDENTESFYDANGQLMVPKVKALSRTYARKVGGVPITMHFDVATNTYKLQYTVQASVTSSPLLARTTEIYVNEKMWYATGVDVSVTPRNAGAKVQITHNLVTIIVPNQFAGQLTVVVSPQ